MASDQYEREINPLCPVAIKVGQTEVHAPGHDTWGTVTCDTCRERFHIGPNRIYGSRNSEQECVRQLEAILVEDHRKQQAHGNCYELIG